MFFFSFNKEARTKVFWTHNFIFCCTVQLQDFCSRQWTSGSVNLFFFFFFCGSFDNEQTNLSHFRFTCKKFILLILSFFHRWFTGCKLGLVESNFSQIRCFALGLRYFRHYFCKDAPSATRTKQHILPQNALMALRFHCSCTDASHWSKKAGHLHVLQWGQSSFLHVFYLTYNPLAFEVALNYILVYCVPSGLLII